MKDYKKGKVYLALELLIESCLSQQKIAKTNHVPANGTDWLNEWATVKMSSARQTGHTTAILRYCQNHSEQRFALACAKEQIATLVEKQAKEMGVKNLTTLSVKRKSFDYLRGVSFNGVFFDMSFWISEKEKQRVVEITLPAMINNSDGYFYAHIQ